MKNLFARLRNRTAAFIHDLMMVPLAWFGAYWLRFNLETIPPAFLQKALALLPLIVTVYGCTFVYFGLYRGIWRFASMHDFMSILKAVTMGATLNAVSIPLLFGVEGVPRSAFILHALLLVALLGLPRFLYRWIRDHRLNYKPANRVLIVGAGQAGETLARELLQNPKGDYYPVAFVDDDRRKAGTEVRGLRVVGRCKVIPQIVSHYAIDVIFIAIPAATTAELRRIVGLCEAGGKPFRTLPRLVDLLQDHALSQELREVSIEDLLGREPISLDWETIRRQLAGQTVLVSGGGGSIGSELCRQVSRLAPAALIILEHSEFNLYEIDRELRARFPTLILHSHLGDVCDVTAVDYWVGHYRPQIIFHAAAYKHVPLLEQQIREAIRNNLFGTINLARAADRYACQTFVLISTDKAVNPSNIMGASKQLAEMYCQNFNYRSNTHFVIVRFGNVMDSAGSVIPLFRQQIRQGGPVTVTHPEVSRYFMTIPEASQLIMQAGAVGQGGEIYVLDMGTPINIRYLAEQMILLSGKSPGKDITIEYIGLRPGEKLHEELFHEEEELKPTLYPKLLLAQHRQLVDWPRFIATLERLREACERYDESTAADLIEGLIPEFQAGTLSIERKAITFQDRLALS
ncbi:MAG: nucleoside-diphosphate sugar epimerase/dehydratase [Candidatus Competibacteraceae bacterium]